MVKAFTHCGGCGREMAEKDCFGILDRVFPMGTEGLREVPQACFSCPQKGECLATALSTKEGLNLREEALERSRAQGWVGWIRRWSERKELSRLMKEKEGNP